MRGDAAATKRAGAVRRRGLRRCGGECASSAAALALGLPMPDPRCDWAHRFHICTGTHRDCARTGLTHARLDCAVQPLAPPPPVVQSDRERLLLSLFDYGTSPGEIIVMFACVHMHAMYVRIATPAALLKYGLSQVSPVTRTRERKAGRKAVARAVARAGGKAGGVRTMTRSCDLQPERGPPAAGGASAAINKWPGSSDSESAGCCAGGPPGSRLTAPTRVRAPITMESDSDSESYPPPH
jgi:hypothetical protein